MEKVIRDGNVAVLLICKFIGYLLARHFKLKNTMVLKVCELWMICALSHNVTALVADY